MLINPKLHVFKRRSPFADFRTGRTFSEQLPSYKKSDYNETLTHRDFIDPFFKALGWDMNNSAGNAEAYREVIYEPHQLNTRIEYTDEKINKLVFGLYGLGEEEMKIVENV